MSDALHAMSIRLRLGANFEMMRTAVLRMPVGTSLRSIIHSSAHRYLAISSSGFPSRHVALRVAHPSFHSPCTDMPGADDTELLWMEEKANVENILAQRTEPWLGTAQAKLQKEGAINMLHMDAVQDIYDVPVENLRATTQGILDELAVPERFPGGKAQRAVHCSRNLSFKSITAIGYDMDYTLIHYDVNAWEGRAYHYGMETLREQGLPVEGLTFKPEMVIRGLIMDKERGNLIKVDQFGLVKRAMHGTRMLPWREIRTLYGREVVKLSNEDRWMFLNTLFSVSEAVIYAQLVDRLDQGTFSLGTGNVYQELYKMVSKALYRTHVEGKLKSEIIQAPEKYVELDPEMAQTLLDQKHSGKQLLLITNSDYEYTNRMMSFAYDRFLPVGMKWRDLFDMVIVTARKPDFFNYNMSLYEVVTEEGLMKPVLSAKKGGLYCGGSAHMVETALGVAGDQILYVGDHIYTDAALAKLNLQWRTALIIRELEYEIDGLARGRPHRIRLKELMTKKELVSDVCHQLRLARQRFVHGLSPGDTQFANGEEVDARLAQLTAVMDALDEVIGPMLEKDGAGFNGRWGYLTRAGLNDKSQLCRQIEKYADIYTSRVSNFLRYTPYVYFRSPSQSMAHDRNIARYSEKMYGPSVPDSSPIAPLDYVHTLHTISNEGTSDTHDEYSYSHQSADTNGNGNGNGGGGGYDHPNDGQAAVDGRHLNLRSLDPEHEQDAL